VGEDIARSTELRKWFGHDPARWAEFRELYAEEIRRRPEQLERLRAIARRAILTLGYAAPDELHNDAVVLCAVHLDDRA
jgi:uncharacterized protein YeaO (DUF488 family)